MENTLRNRFPTTQTKEFEEKPETQKPRVVRQIPQGSITVAILLTVIALWTRLYKINLNDHVVWDEAHFGKFAGYYIKRKFYFDVHPPLGKMINALAGLFAGFNGRFEFESGAKYPDEVRYGVMRVFNGVFGAMVTPLAYWTGIHMNLSHHAAILLAVMTITDVAYCAISRFILLDSMLLFFTCFAVYCLCVFRSYQLVDPFSPDWFLWLYLSGISLGLVLSVKWVGLFAIALVGLHTVGDLWSFLGDVKMPPKTGLMHLGARVVCLIIVPIIVYMISFGLHFGILNESGPGDAQMSSLFQAGLQGNNFQDNPLEIAYGSKVTFKSNIRGGGLLHSHVQRYPSGSEQQQVTTYSHKDSNNDFIISRPWGAENPAEDAPPQLIVDGDIIRLTHEQTKKNIHSHQVKAPITETEWEVSGYGTDTVGDSNDHWRIERIEDVYVPNSNRIRALTTKFRLVHVNLNCTLRADGVNLPEWGFKQGEIVCQKKPGKDSSNLWNIELHEYPKLPPAGKADFKSSFFRDFLDLNVAMWSSNNALIPDPDKEPGQLESKPYHWPFLLRGLRMCGWGAHEVKYYLLGNPLIWWGSTLALITLPVLLLVFIIRSNRGFKDLNQIEWDNFLFAAKVGWLGWFLHYIPFYIMGRVMYVHHYFPALYFAMISFVVLMDQIRKFLPKYLGLGLLVACAMAFTITFLFFADFAFGMEGPAEKWSNRQWLSSWNIY